MFKIKNKLIHFIYFPSVSNVDLEQANVCEKWLGLRAQNQGLTSVIGFNLTCVCNY